MAGVAAVPAAPASSHGYAARRTCRTRPGLASSPGRCSGLTSIIPTAQRRRLGRISHRAPLRPPRRSARRRSRRSDRCGGVRVVRDRTSVRTRHRNAAGPPRRGPRRTRHRGADPALPAGRLRADLVVPPRQRRIMPTGSQARLRADPSDRLFPASAPRMKCRARESVRCGPLHRHGQTADRAQARRAIHRALTALARSWSSTHDHRTRPWRGTS